MFPSIAPKGRDMKSFRLALLESKVGTGSLMEKKSENCLKRGANRELVLMKCYKNCNGTPLKTDEMRIDQPCSK